MLHWCTIPTASDSMHVFWMYCFIRKRGQYCGTAASAKTVQVWERRFFYVHWGFRRETIYEDYMKTNLYLDEEMNHMVRYLESKMIVDNQTMDKIRLFYRVKEEYLDCVFETIEKDYGSVEQFMKKALYMHPKTIEALRKKYLV